MKFFHHLPLLVCLVSCSSLQPVKDISVQHVLDPLVAERPLTAARPSLGIKRPSIPSYLDRQQWVTRQGGQLMVSRLDLWGEPLDAGISRVMASNLSRLTRSTNCQPVENFTTPDYTHLLEMRISRFEIDSANSIVFEGTWKLQPTQGGEATNHFFHLEEPVSSGPGESQNRLAAMNRALEKLSRQIAAHL